MNCWCRCLGTALLSMLVTFFTMNALTLWSMQRAFDRAMCLRVSHPSECSETTTIETWVRRAVAMARYGS